MGELDGQPEQRSFFSDGETIGESPYQIPEVFLPPQQATTINPDGGKPTPKMCHDSVDSYFQLLIAEMERGPSPHLLDYLAQSARFYKYSSSNQVLIAMQAPDAKFVASFGLWKKMGYHIREGAKAIWIWAPTTYKKKESVPKEDGSGEEEETIIIKTGYKPVPVHPDSNIENLDEKPLPEFFSPLGNNHDTLAERLITAMQQEGINVITSPLGKIQGLSQGGQVILSRDQDSTNTCLTAIHEWTHELLHQSRPDKGRNLEIRVLECHAEAVAFIVAMHFGIHNPFSADYLLNWGNTPKTLMTELEMVQRAANHIIKAIEKPYQSDDADTEQKPRYKKRPTHTKRMRAK